MKKNKKGAHAAEPSNSSKTYLILFIIILFIIIIGIYFKTIYIPTHNDNTPLSSSLNNFPLLDIHMIENSSYLISKDFSINESDGISKVKANVENCSENTLKNLNFVYTLYDNSNNIVYEFEISISNLEAHSSSSFSSVCTTDLSNVTNYSVRLDI